MSGFACPAPRTLGRAGPECRAPVIVVAASGGVGDERAPPSRVRSPVAGARGGGPRAARRAAANESQGPGVAAAAGGGRTPRSTLLSRLAERGLVEPRRCGRVSEVVSGGRGIQCAAVEPPAPGRRPCEPAEAICSGSERSGREGARRAPGILFYDSVEARPPSEAQPGRYGPARTERTAMPNRARAALIIVSLVVTGAFATLPAAASAHPLRHHPHHHYHFCPPCCPPCKR